MKLIVLLCLLLLGCANPPREAAWTTHDFDAFTVSLPSLLAYFPEQGEDSFVGRFEAPGVRVEFDYGAHSDPLAYDEEVGFSRVDRVIDGRPAVIAAWREKESGSHVSAVHFPSAGSSDHKLTIYVFSRTPYPPASRIFESVTMARRKPNQTHQHNAGGRPPMNDSPAFDNPSSPAPRG
jgi:hypothetical protein